MIMETEVEMMVAVVDKQKANTENHEALPLIFLVNFFFYFYKFELYAFTFCVVFYSYLLCFLSMIFTWKRFNKTEEFCLSITKSFSKTSSIFGKKPFFRFIRIHSCFINLILSFKRKTWILWKGFKWYRSYDKVFLSSWIWPNLFILLNITGILWWAFFASWKFMMECPTDTTDRSSVDKKLEVVYYNFF